MNTLSKKQVLALFLGTAVAETPLQVYKDLGPNTPMTLVPVADSNNAQKVNSGSACNALGGCDVDGESCARITTSATPAVDPVDACLQEEWCGSYGRVDGAQFAATCWTKVAQGETPVAPTTPTDITADLAAIESLITKTTVSWDSEAKLVVSSRFNYFDGWYIHDTENQNTGMWEEVDKPTDNRCFLDIQCDPDKCCSFYPNDKNRRCILKTDHWKSINVGPVTIEPHCPTLGAKPGTTDTSDTSGTTTDPVTPENAKDDIAAGALAKAKEEIETWEANKLADEKKKVFYGESGCLQACMDIFDMNMKAQKDEDDKLHAELRTTAGYDTDACDDTCKAVFDVELLTWMKAVYEQCKADQDSIECTNAVKLKKDEEKARGPSFYTGTDEERTAKKEAYKAEAEKAKAALVAAWLEDDTNLPQDGAEGAKCSDILLCAEGLCCGTMSKTGATTARDGNFCAKNTGYTDNFKQTYTHVCSGLNAFKITSSIAAAVATAYYM